MGGSGYFGDRRDEDDERLIAFSVNYSVACIFMGPALSASLSSCNRDAIDNLYLHISIFLNYLNGIYLIAR